MYKDCIQSAINGQLVTYDNGDPVQCFGPSTFWMEPMPNQADELPDALRRCPERLQPEARIDVNAGYSIYQFNPAWQDRLFMGRYFRFGARVEWSRACRCGSVRSPTGSAAAAGNDDLSGRLRNRGRPACPVPPSAAASQR